VIEFPETAQREWEVVAEAAEAEHKLRQRIQHATEVEREMSRLRVRHEANLSFQSELDADATPVLEMLTLSDYRANPTNTPVDLIDGVVKDNGLCIMLGPSGSGKSTIALQMVHSLATGEDWLGQTAKPLMGGYGILSYDMDAGMVMDWMDGYPNMDPTKVSVVNAYKRGNPLGVPAMRAQIAAAWRSMNTEVVVLDSFSASFFGHDQNDAAAVMSHYRDMKLFALTEVGARALIIIVHSTEASPYKARGSTVHHDVADSIVGVEGTGSDERKVRMVKYRAARGQKQMDPVVLTVPDPTTHLVDLDTGAMTLAGFALPASVVADAFTDMPDTHAEPDTDSTYEGDDDL
jgi:archaellum biogenesis ATPase FlaH